MLDRIQTVQLDILGISREYRLLVGIFICMIVITLIFFPLIKFLSSRYYVAVLTYLMTSFLMMGAIVFCAQILHEPYIIYLGLRVMVAFGFVYAVFLIYKRLKNAYRYH